MICKFFAVFIFIFSTLSAEIRAIWLPIWELTTHQKIENAIQEIAENNFNQILVQVRYRGDAAYTPNKSNDFYDNKEMQYHALSDSILDPFAYLIEVARKQNIEVHAWIPVFVITGHKLEKLTSQNLYFTKSEWITADSTGQKMNYLSHSGAFLDPGILKVQKYTENIIMDIALNYDIDGIHLDYIRYPDIEFGYNNLALKRYFSENNNTENWQNWKEKQITNFVENIYQKIRAEAPFVKLSAAVFANIETAKSLYSQNWQNWLEKGIIDNVYLMDYSTSSDVIEAHLSRYENIFQSKKIVFGLRAWSEDCSYPVSQINEKIQKIKKHDFGGISLYSFTGIKQCKYFQKGLEK